MITEIYVGAVWSDGSVSHEAIQVAMRSAERPQGNWAIVRGDATLWYLRGDDRDIEAVLARIAARRLELDGLTLVSWKRLSDDEHKMFEEDRPHRNALELVGGEVRHNMPKARELHKKLLRHQGIEKLLVLDGKWSRANGIGDEETAKAIEAERATIRAIFDDPRIEAAQTLEELKQVQVPDVPSVPKTARR